MVHRCRRFILPAVLLLAVLAVSAGRVSIPDRVRAAYDPTTPAFDPLSEFDVSPVPNPVFQPPRLLAGTNSHALPADAATRNGYCVDVNIEGVTPADTFLVPGPALGFQLTASQPIDSASPPTINVPIPSTGPYAYISAPAPGVDGFNNGIGTTTDDVYCVVAYAPPGYKKLGITWHYNDGTGIPASLSLPDLDIVTVTLQKIGDGIIGGPAEVCTVGWDDTFLTGATSNTPSDPLVVSPGVYDPVNQVAIADWSVPSAPPGVTIAYVRQAGFEWCAGIAATAPVSGLAVEFDFHAIYNRTDIGTPVTIDKDGDDQEATIGLPVTVTLKIVASVELRHVTSDGKVPPRQRSAQLVIDSTHYVCVVGATDPTDSLTVVGIQFSPLAGADVPGVGNLTAFRKSAAHDPRLNGVANDTWCFSYTSPSAGEHTVSVSFLNNGVPDVAFFDTNDDGNGVQTGPGSAGPLITRWNHIDRTEITTGRSPTAGVVTYTADSLAVIFNAGTGTLIGSRLYREWVLGSHSTGGILYSDQILDGAWIEARIDGSCGYFSVPSLSQPKTVRGVSIGGRFELNNGDGNPFSAAYGDTDAVADDLLFSTLNDPGCTAGSTVRIEIDVFYPGDTTPAAPQEWVGAALTFSPANMTPRIAWAGQTVTITYAFGGGGSCAGQQVIFVRPEDQRGNFLPGPGITLNGPYQATADFGAACSATVLYESEEPGEVDVSIFLANNPNSKAVVPLFFLMFEDIVIEATPDQFVSTFGSVSAGVRGYFVGSNPSGRPAEIKPDGRKVPRDRWVMPDDWDKLLGPGGLRGNWGSIEMPAAIVTFFMDSEPTINDYRKPVKTGSSGFFVPDDSEDFSFNVNPHTKATTVLGTPAKPRMMSQPSDASGNASVFTFGDMNLTYEECPPSKFNGNPQCQLENIVGTGRYYAVAEYPDPKTHGKWPAIASNKAETTWRWAGYKEVTIVNTDSPAVKYVVAHLRDRDGFCDAANYNNTLGVPVRFEIDAGGGAIVGAADRPYSINDGRRFATVTSFDTLDVLEHPANPGLAMPTIEVDECQAWIKVSNSLMKPTNVVVTFPAQPAPIPGEVRVTGLQCSGEETITVKNVGTNPVNLAGFGLESLGTEAGIAQQRDLSGYLEPGQSKMFFGAPAVKDNLWIGVDNNEVFSGPDDFVMLTWNDYVISTVFCDGRVIDNPLPATLVPDGEGEIVIDIVIPYGQDQTLALAEGWNMVPTGAGTAEIATVIGGAEDAISIIYAWDSEKQEWKRYIPGAPASVNTITTFGDHAVFWVHVKRPLTLTVPK